MKKLQTIMGALILLFYAHITHANHIISIEKLEDIPAHVKPNTLVVFGGLNTLFKTSDPARWPYQWNERINYMQSNKGYHHSKSAAEKDLRAIHPFTPTFIPTEPAIEKTIQDIRERGGKVVCITRLPQHIHTGDVNKGITACLEKCGIDLAADWVTIPPAANEQFTTTTPFLNGIIHAGASNLGDLLLFFLGFSNSAIDCIVAIDDQETNLEDYGSAADALECPCTCLLFKTLHTKPHGFTLTREIKHLLPQRKGPRAEKITRQTTRRTTHK